LYAFRIQLSIWPIGPPSIFSRVVEDGLSMSGDKK
jgi:hypothetical protein